MGIDSISAYETVVSIAQCRCARKYFGWSRKTAFQSRKHDEARYVTLGVYPETLVVANGVSVYRGYDTSWERSPANITKITGVATPSGDSTAATAEGVSRHTNLQLLTLALTRRGLPRQRDGIWVTATLSRFGEDALDSYDRWAPKTGCTRFDS
jgi:hypothetical protein